MSTGAEYRSGEWGRLAKFAARALLKEPRSSERPGRSDREPAGGATIDRGAKRNFVDAAAMRQHGLIATE